MGGDLSAASAVGRGSLFILSLPLASPEDAAAQTPASAAGISDYHPRRMCCRWKRSTSC